MSPTMPTLTKRAKLIREAMSGTNWTSVSNIMDAVAPMLLDQHNRRLVPTALRTAVRYALDELVAHGLAETKTEVGERGKAHRFVRRAQVCSAPESSVSAHVADQ